MSLRDQLVTYVLAKLGDVPAPHLARVVKAADLDQARHSPFTAVALDNGAVGISYNLFHRDAPAVLRYRAWDENALTGRPIRDVIPQFLAKDLLARTIGFATLNAVCQWLLNQPPYQGQIDLEHDVLDLLAPQPDERIGMVGYFPPTARQLVGRVRELVVVEKEERMLQPDAPFSMTIDPVALSRCDKVLITATTILNDTLESLLAHCSQANFVAVMGPSAGICPEPLFDIGVDVLAGTLISQPERFLARFARGEKWGDAKRKFIIQRPGWRQAI